jgi:hypothetical protein
LKAFYRFRQSSQDIPDPYFQIWLILQSAGDIIVTEFLSANNSRYASSILIFFKLLATFRASSNSKQMPRKSSHPFQSSAPRLDPWEADTLQDSYIPDILS